MGRKKGYGFYFMIIGLVIGIFSISFYYSYDNSMKINILDEIDGKAKYEITSENKIKETGDYFKNNKNGIFIEKSITINNKIYKVIGMNKYALDKYNLKINGGKILVGKGFEKLSHTKNGREILEINKENYEIDKVVKNNGFAFTIIMSLDDFISRFKEESLFTFDITYIGENINKKEVIENINDLELKGVGGSKLIINEVNFDEGEDTGLKFIPLVIVVVSFINVCTFSLMWINSRKKEISLYKAVGANNFEIFKMLIFEIIEISVVSLLIALIIQYGANYVVNSNNLIGKYLYIDLKTLTKCGVVILVMSFLSVLPSYIASRYYKPAETLKEE